MEKLLVIIGICSSIYGIGYFGYWVSKKVKIRLPKNPIKQYIRKEVMSYLKELQND